MRTLLSFLLPTIVLLVNVSIVQAAFTFSTNQITITPDQEITAQVTLSLQGQANKTYYVEGAFKKDDGTNYFGLTWNNQIWTPYTASNQSTLLQIITDQNGSWTGELRIKLDEQSSFYTGPGNYLLRLKRFTSTGSSSSWSDESIPIQVTSSTPLPIPISSQTPSSLPTPSSTTIASPTPASSTFTITKIPTAITSSQTFPVSVTLVLPSYHNSLFYLKGAFRKADKSNYFGFTKYQSNWVKNNENFAHQYQIITNNAGEWEGTIELKPDSEDSGFTGTGEYALKVGRYDSNGAGPTWSNAVVMTITHTTLPSNLSSSPPFSPTNNQGTDTKDQRQTKQTDYLNTINDETIVYDLPLPLTSLEKTSSTGATLGIASPSANTTDAFIKEAQILNSEKKILPIVAGSFIIITALGWGLRIFFKHENSN